MEDAEEFINSVLNDHQENNKNNVEYIEGEEVGEHVLAMLGCDDDDDDDVAVEENNKDVEEYMMNSAEENNNNNNIEYIEGEEVGEHILAVLQDFDLDSIDFVL
ncbi:hypothetical protein HAX54_041377 [Datura stramonium]|uniref:Uncharacterized protein n=1 Tax=Datura stramonium TaxID=4076 RepID=A0ABS8VQI4_DATST|nr:hypothetical protein [Datura stramonium]